MAVILGKHITEHGDGLVEAEGPGHPGEHFSGEDAGDVRQHGLQKMGTRECYRGHESRSVGASLVCPFLILPPTSGGF